jgi:hypothetical protein
MRVMKVALVLVAALGGHASAVERAPLAVCAALEAEGFEGASGAPMWMEDGLGNYGCAAQVQVGARDGARRLASAVQFMAESRDKTVVQKISLTAAIFNGKTKAQTLKRLRNVAEELFRAMALEAPGNVFAVIEKPRAASAKTPYGAVRFAQVEGVNIDEWTLTVMLDGSRTATPAVRAAH